jgi:hypothetical protein
METPSCGTVPLPVVALGGAYKTTVPLFVTGTNAMGVIDGSALAADYVPLAVGSDGTFIICIETAAPIAVQLADGSDFTITAVQATAYLGKWYPAKLLTVYKSGTTGDFQVGF